MGPGRARRERVRAALRVAVEMTGRALASQPASPGAARPDRSVYRVP